MVQTESDPQGRREVAREHAYRRWTRGAVGSVNRWMASGGTLCLPISQCSQNAKGRKIYRRYLPSCGIIGGPTKINDESIKGECLLYGKHVISIGQRSS